MAGRVLSVVDMPIPGSRHAPKKFKGHYADVENFLNHYEKLLTLNNVTTDKERCETIKQYCSRKVARCIEGMEHYNTPNWKELKKDILQFFDADKNKRRYKVKDLKNLISEQKRKHIYSRESWIKYTRKFITIAGWLKANKKIDAIEEATYFWKGIHPTFRRQLETRLLSKNPAHDFSTPFSIEDVRTMADGLLRRDRFDNDDSEEEESESQNSSDEGTASDGDSDSESDSDSDDSDEGYALVKTPVKSSLKKKAKKNSKTVKSKSKTRDPKEDPIRPLVSTKEAKKTIKKLEKEGSKANKQDEMESLIKQLNSVSINDPNYGLLYYRAVKMDPDVALVLKSPLTRQSGTQNRPSSSQTNAVTPLREEMTCYGRGEKGHGLDFCPKINNLITQGVIMKDANGKLVMKDGSRIIKMTTETFVDAIEKTDKPRANLIITEIPDTPSANHWINPDSEEENDAYPVSSNTRSTNSKGAPKKTREVLDGVYPPPVPGKAGSKTMPPRTQIQTPIDVHLPQPRDIDDDAIMEDTPMTKKPASDKDAPKKAIKTTRQSDVAAHVNPFDILNKVLNAPVTLPAGEIIGVSKELSQMLQEVIKPKSQKPTSGIVAHSFATKTRGVLIKLQISCDNRPINAFIDTGSMLNICNENTWKTAIKRPMDISQSLVMNDANGGDGTLRGLVENVPLRCGKITTITNLFVGEHVPFDLLLGRPWQRGNYVTIDERKDGTYLLFKDPDNLEVRYEIMVTPDGSNPDWSYEPATWVTTSNTVFSGAVTIKEEDLFDMFFDLKAASLTREEEEEQLPTDWEIIETKDSQKQSPYSRKECSTHQYSCFSKKSTTFKEIEGWTLVETFPSEKDKTDHSLIDQIKEHQVQFDGNDSLYIKSDGRNDKDKTNHSLTNYIKGHQDQFDGNDSSYIRIDEHSINGCVSRSHGKDHPNKDKVDHSLINQIKGHQDQFDGHSIKGCVSSNVTLSQVLSMSHPKRYIKTQNSSPPSIQPSHPINHHLLHPLSSSILLPHNHLDQIIMSSFTNNLSIDSTADISVINMPVDFSPPSTPSALSLMHSLWTHGLSVQHSNGMARPLVASTSNGILLARGESQLGQFEEFIFLNAAFSFKDPATGQTSVVPSTLFVTRYDQPVSLPTNWLVPILDVGDAQRVDFSQIAPPISFQSTANIFANAPSQPPPNHFPPTPTSIYSPPPFYSGSPMSISSFSSLGSAIHAPPETVQPMMVPQAPQIYIPVMPLSPESSIPLLPIIPELSMSHSSIPTMPSQLSFQVPIFISNPDWDDNKWSDFIQLHANLDDLVDSVLPDVAEKSRLLELDPQTVMDAKLGVDSFIEGLEELAVKLGFQWDAWYQTPLVVLNEDGQEFTVPKGHFFTNRFQKGFTSGNPLLNPHSRNNLDNLKLYFQEMAIKKPDQDKFLDHIRKLQDWRDTEGMVLGTRKAFF